jgi:hypothetical protein
MVPGFKNVLAASANDRRDLFVGTGVRLGTVEQNIEKDFWVCWTLDAHFNGLEPGGPRLLFKGGTSLSKGYGLIARFSEDIDITVFREDIGEPASVEELEALSGKKRAARLDAIRAACQTFINGPLREQLGALLRAELESANLPPNSGRVETDPDAPDHHSPLLSYPSVTAEGADYIRRIVKIESGRQIRARSTLSDNAIKPYVADELKEVPLKIANVTTVHPDRTFWDKVVILHGLRRCGSGTANCEEGDSVSRGTTTMSTAWQRLLKVPVLWRIPRCRMIVFAMRACSSTDRTSTWRRL